MEDNFEPYNYFLFAKEISKLLDQLLFVDIPNSLLDTLEVSNYE